MPGQFASPKRRISRAKEHIADIKSRVGSFFHTKPYTRAVERNSDGLDEHKVNLTSDIPNRITDLSYEAIEALRSSLDQAMYPVAVANGTKRPDLIHFPIADSSTDIESILNSRGLKDFPPDILTLLRGFKPYHGGNDLIWALNRIRRQSTHRLIVPVGVGIKAPRWNGEKNELVYAVAQPGASLDYDLNIAFFIAFGPVEGLAGQPVVDVLTAITAETERIVPVTLLCHRTISRFAKGIIGENREHA